MVVVVRVLVEWVQVSGDCAREPAWLCPFTSWSSVGEAHRSVGLRGEVECVYGNAIYCVGGLRFCMGHGDGGDGGGGGR